MVTALAEGVVDKLLVVEGQEVKQDEPIARLIEDDARLALRTAEADQRMCEAEMATVTAALAAARTNVAHPVHLQATLADAEAMLAKMETELETLPFQLRAARAREKLARENHESRLKISANGAVPELSLRQSETELETAAATAQELKAREPRLQKEIAALSRKCAALRKQLELKTEETRQLGEAEAKLQSCQARYQHAQVAVDKARLMLARMTVRAPASGRVLALLARPGMRLMGLAPGSLHESSTVVTLYQPAALQIRADVRLEDVPRVQPGQAVKIETPAVPNGPLDGEVLFPTSQADIQKNTLQVKVGIKAPPPVLKPDMLVQVTFLAPPVNGEPASAGERLRVLVPRQLIESAAGGPRIWVADQVGRTARLKAIKLGLGMQGDLIEVADGLTPADKLIAGGREGLTDGQRISISAEEGGLETPSRESVTTPARLPRSPAGNAESKNHH
jgi:RND family efflux transporter MFP subunit